MNNDKINLKNLIDNAISFYDKNNDKFKKYINDKNYILDIEEGKIIFNDKDKKFNYELLGVFDKINLIWIWSWMIPSVSSEKTLLTKKILNFGLSLNVFIDDIDDDQNEKLYLKTQFVNSRFYMSDNFQLKMNIILSSFIIKNDFLFLYPIKNKSNNFNIIKFLIIKDN